MTKSAENKVSKWIRWERTLKKWEYWIALMGIVLTVGVALAVVFYWEGIQALGSYGYLGAFLIGVLGGTTYIAPVPMTPIIFMLGIVLKPSFAPYLGPVFVGVAAGLGETVGGLTIYMTGYGGGAALASSRHAKVRMIYLRIVGWMERRGTLVLFLFSSTLNPFFYPVAIAAGATRFGLKKYIFICIIGKSIKGLTVAAAGYWGLGSILRALGVPI